MSLRVLVLVLVLSLCFCGALAVSRNSDGLLRLVASGGGSRCQGELQVQMGGQWFGVFGPFISQLFGQRLCAELDCGLFLSAKEKTTPLRGAFVLFIHYCDNTSLIDCLSGKPHPLRSGVELNCSDSMRLDPGQTSCSGSLLIRDQSLNQSWTPVCEGALDRRGAEVLCRELGCEPPVLQGALPPLGQMFQCEGHESALMDCPRNQTRTEPGTCSPLHVTCSEPVRLAGGSNRCEGTLEVKYQGEWKRLMVGGNWNLRSAATVCPLLDCGSVLSMKKKDNFNSTEVVATPGFCDMKMSLRDCVFNNFTSSLGVEVVCSDSVRLVSERSLCSGSLQIRDQSWTPVCEGALDRRGAEVLCRQVDCGGPLLQGALSPLGQMFHCEGHESALMDCPRNQTRTEAGTCSPLHLTCSDPLRLVGGSGRCEGTLEMKDRGQWRRAVAPYDFPWDLEMADVVCRVLGCGAAVNAEQSHADDWSKVWGVQWDCVRTATLRGCVFDVPPFYFHGLFVVCSDSVRLVSGRSQCSGSLQIRNQSLDQSWTPVCEGALDRRGAEVVCRELGCGAPLFQGALSPLGQTFHCEGHESALMDCPRNQTRTEAGTCSPLRLTCSEPLRLVGGSGRCEGIVELMHRRQWRRAVTLFYPWDRKTAGAVCQFLGCGSAVETTKIQDFDWSEVWGMRAECVRAAKLRDCVYDRQPSAFYGVFVVCSGQQGAPEETQSSH